MATYKLTVLIDQMPMVQKAKAFETLNLAKQGQPLFSSTIRHDAAHLRAVNGRFSTVFAGAAFRPRASQQQEIRQANKFQWTEEYSVFLAGSGHAGMMVRAIAPWSFYAELTIFTGHGCLTSEDSRFRTESSRRLEIP
jgi:hypothetical protein